MHHVRTWALAGAATLALGMSLANAQDIGSVISFGDSLSDNGNLAAVAGVPPAPPSPPYFDGRFSNGPVFTERLDGAMQKAGAASVARRPVNPNANQNYAFGGATASPRVSSPPNIYTQIGFFAAQDGVFAANDLVTLYAGANDIFAAVGAPNASFASVSAGSRQAAQDVSGAAALLGRLNAPRVVVLNLPNLGGIPLLNSNPGASFLGSTATDAFNSQLQNGIFATAAANPGSDYYYVDVRRLSDAITADPGRFGFSNVTDACFQRTTGRLCSTSPQVQNTYLYFDDVHPTAAGHQLYSALVLDYVTASSQAASAGAMSETAFADRLQSANASYDRGHDFALASRNGTTFSGLYGEVNGLVYDRDSGSAIRSYDYASAGISLGYERPLGESFMVGTKVSFGAGDIDDSSFAFDTMTFAADIYGTAVMGAAYVTASAGIAHVDFDNIERGTLIPTVVNAAGDTNAAVANIGLAAGYDIAMGQLTVTPNAALTYAHFDVDGFTETGIGARIAYQDYDRDALYGNVGVDLSYDAMVAGRAATLTASIAYEDELFGNDDSIRSSIVGSPNRVRSAGFDELPGRGVVLGARAMSQLSENTNVSAAYSFGFGDEIDNSHEGRVSVGFKF
ncbi:autotransporter domain-containing protein [Fulvimarina sp. MAC3]|uniref:autotransporter domain-containing protein n=1 Tax=Fulvimarina sp. MAC3 TaxID=3148887 RepID=UPI0031FC9C82